MSWRGISVAAMTVVGTALQGDPPCRGIWVPTPVEVTQLCVSGCI
jgi:hypothetical protein